VIDINRNNPRDIGRNWDAVLVSRVRREEKIRAGIVIRTANCCRTGLFFTGIKLPVRLITPRMIGRKMAANAEIIEFIFVLNSYIGTESRQEIIYFLLKKNYLKKSKIIFGHLLMNRFDQYCIMEFLARSIYLSTIKDFRSVAVIGAGALGLLYMESISKIQTIDSYFLTDDSRYYSLKNKKFTINSRQQTYKVNRAVELRKKPDLILICVKNYHLNSLSPLLREVADSETTIISVLNGISSEIFLEELLPDSTVLYCAVLGMDAVKEGDTLNYTRKGKSLIGNKNNRKSEKLTSVCDFLVKCNLEYFIPEDIHRELWYKWMINIGVNQVSALTGAPYGLFQMNRIVQELMEDAMRETIQIAEAELVNLKVDDINKWYEVLNTLGPDGKTSMLQDMEAGRKTEVESFSGELLNRARKLGIPAPVNETLFRSIKTRELLFLGE